MITLTNEAAKEVLNALTSSTRIYSEDDERDWLKSTANAVSFMEQALAAPALPLAAPVSDKEIIAHCNAAGVEPAALDGWKLVPVEPTPGMRAKSWRPDRHGYGYVSTHAGCEIYSAMLAAAPQPPAQLTQP